MSEREATFRNGDEVYVFYRMGKRCRPQRKYMAVLGPRQGAYRPRTGISDGWVPARVVEEKEGAVKVTYTWPHFFTQRGHCAERDGSYTEWYRASDVKPASDQLETEPSLPLIPRDSQPELALITFRWGGINEVIAPGQWGETGSSVSDIFIEAFVDSGIWPNIGNNYEVWTVYVEDHSDMLRVAQGAHLIFGPSHPSSRARHRRAMYHLYPTAFEENCVPSRETGEDSGAALVDQKSLFQMIKAVERAGIPTGFPHPSGFYELITSKRWTYMMTMTPALRVPPTISVPRMLVEQSCPAAAELGLKALQEVKDHQFKLRGEAEKTSQIVKGVAKLGFSWEALDVKFWQGQSGLQEALSQLTQTIEISQELTGQPHDLEAIIVQEYCEHELEMRLYVVEDQVESTIFTKFLRIKDNNEFGDFKELFSLTEAAEAWMGGDVEALEEGERQCREITQHWLTWVRAQVCKTPPAIRFDYFVGRAAGPSGGAASMGQVVVWTLEICELGFSMLGDKTLPEKVFAAMYRSMVDAPIGGLPAPKTSAASAPGPPGPSATAGATAPEAAAAAAASAPAVVAGSAGAGAAAAAAVAGAAADGAGEQRSSRGSGKEAPPTAAGAPSGTRRSAASAGASASASAGASHAIGGSSAVNGAVGAEAPPAAAGAPSGARRSADSAGASAGASRATGGSSAVNGAVGAEEGEGPVPAQIFVVVPAGFTTPDQQRCTGKYEPVAGVRPNGMPVFMHTSGSRWLYHGNDGYWYVGDEDEADMNFECDQGYIRHVGHGSTHPHCLEGAWQRGPEWTLDGSITVSDQAPPKGKQKGKGKNGSSKGTKH